MLVFEIPIDTLLNIWVKLVLRAKKLGHTTLGYLATIGRTKPN